MAGDVGAWLGLRYPDSPMKPIVQISLDVVTIDEDADPPMALIRDAFRL